MYSFFAFSNLEFCYCSSSSGSLRSFCSGVPLSEEIRSKLLRKSRFARTSIVLSWIRWVQPQGLRIEEDKRGHFCTFGKMNGLVLSQNLQRNLQEKATTLNVTHNLLAFHALSISLQRTFCLLELRRSRNNWEWKGFELREELRERGHKEGEQNEEKKKGI